MNISKKERARLAEMYQKAVYEVRPRDREEPIVLRAGAMHPPLDALLTRNEHWMFITAYEPMGQPQAPEINKRAQQDLWKEVKTAGKTVWHALGYDPRAGFNWKEPSLFVFPVSRTEALAWARKFNQLAILYGTPGQPADLIFTQ
jgi:hypothetical protein